MPTKRIEDTTTAHRTILSCIVCNTKFSLPNCHAKRRGVGKYCSSNCQREHQSRVREGRARNCIVCGRKFYARTTQIKCGQGILCSTKCRGLYLVGENNGFYGKHHSTETIELIFNTRRSNGLILYGEANSCWKGGYVSRDGYKMLSIKGVPIAEHRHVMGKYLGRKLNIDEIVHHLDGDKLNNDINNLIIVSRAEHASIHAEWNRYYKCV